ncbi:MAG: ABC transporter permease [Acidobacteriota bacterium]
MITQLVDSFVQDLRIAMRTLAKRPAWSGVAVFVLALGIGANVAIFSVAYSVMARPLPYEAPDRLASLWPGEMINKQAYVALAERTSSFAAVSVSVPWAWPLADAGGEPEVVTAGRVTASHFEVLAARPELGRLFDETAQEPGNERVAVLGHALWQRRYGGDPSILGRTIHLDGHAHEVIGVMPASHRPLDPSWQLWTPLPIDRTDTDDLARSFYLRPVARLAPGVTMERASAEVRALAAALRDENPQRFTNDRVESARALPLAEVIVGDARPMMRLLFAAVSLIFLAACANVATLLLTRATTRRRELAVRRALGAGRSRIARQLLTESLVLALVGGVCGVLTAVWTFDVLRAQLPAGMPRLNEIALDRPVLLFAVVLAVVAAAFFGSVPAWRGARVDAAEPLRGHGGTAGRRHHGLAELLVVAQVASAVVLLAGAALLLQSLLALGRVDPGFATENRLTLLLVPPAVRYAEPEERVTFWRQVREELNRVPGVRAAEATHILPFGAGNWSFPYRYEGQVIPPDQPMGTSLPVANFRVVTEDYFRAMEIPLLAGRPFRSADRADGAPVGMINRTLAEQLWPGESAVGKTIYLFGSEANAFTVTGVVADVHQHSLRHAPVAEMYRPLAQYPDPGSFRFVVHTEGDPMTLLPALSAAVWSVDPQVPITSVNQLEAVVAGAVADARTAARLVGAFAVLALVLGCVGILGLVSYSVEQRRREVGIRLALGAGRRRVIAGVLSRGFRLAFGGAVLGVVVVVLASDVVAALLYGVAPNDPLTLFTVASGMAVLALAACWWPARRAARVDPVHALRSD